MDNHPSLLVDGGWFSHCLNMCPCHQITKLVPSFLFGGGHGGSPQVIVFYNGKTISFIRFRRGISGQSHFRMIHERPSKEKSSTVGYSFEDTLTSLGRRSPSLCTSEESVRILPRLYLDDHDCLRWRFQSHHGFLALLAAVHVGGGLSALVGHFRARIQDIYVFDRICIHNFTNTCIHFGICTCMHISVYIPIYIPIICK